MSKVPAITLAFWIIKIAATTLGETGGDALSMTMNLSYAIGSVIFLVFFLHEGLNLSRISSSAVIVFFMIACILLVYPERRTNI